MDVSGSVFVTKKDVVTINVIIIEFLSLNDWLLAVFILSKSKGRAL